MHGSNPGQGIWFGPDVFAADILDLADNLRFEYHSLKMFAMIIVLPRSHTREQISYIRVEKRIIHIQSLV